MLLPVRTVLLSLALLGCDLRRGEAPDWVASAPAPAVAAVSCQVGWAMEPGHLEALMARFPQAERALDRFLEQTRISPRDPGRITLYLADPPVGSAPEPDLLIQLGGLGHPGVLEAAMADAFPSAGNLAQGGRELPLFAVLDLDPHRFRAWADGEGRVWLGDQAVLGRLGSGRGRDSRALAAAMAPIHGEAAIQGFIRPAAGAGPGRTGEAVPGLPGGIDALAWSLTPGAEPKALNRFELVLRGSRGAVLEAGPWLQRLAVAATAATPAGPAQAPDLLQESRQLVLRCQLSQEQLDLVLAKLALPAIPCH